MTDDGAPGTGRRPSRRRSSRSGRDESAATPPPDRPVDAAAAEGIDPAGAGPASPDPGPPGPAAAEASDEVVDGPSGIADVAAPLSAIWSRHPESRPWLPVIDDRSPNAWVCPFLRAVDADEEVLAPVEAPDVTNRCAALHDPVPQSLRQQELVCLTAAHVNCPRYLRGAVGVAEVEATVRDGRALRPAVVLPARPSISPAIVASIGVLLVAFLASVSFVVARGGLELAAAAPSASQVAVVETPSPTSQPTLAPSPTIAPSPTPTVAPTASPTPRPTPTPEPTPAPTPEPTPEPTASPRPTSDRYALLVACPDARDCWIYTVRRGDNLFSIANYFGVSLEAVYARNPWARTQSLQAGQELRLPPPTR